MSYKYTFDAKAELNRCVTKFKQWYDKNCPGKPIVFGASGGKDSSITGAIVARAIGKENTYAVLMPNGIQPDIDDSRALVKALGINSIEVNIEGIVKAVDAQFETLGIENTNQAKQNLDPRARMIVLRNYAQRIGGFVLNTCNLSEDLIGWFTIDGDGAGDYSILEKYTATEVVLIGREMEEIPRYLVDKVPADGLCGLNDEEKFGFSYAVLDKYIRTGEIEDLAIKEKIDKMIKNSVYKRRVRACVYPPLSIILDPYTAQFA